MMMIQLIKCIIIISHFARCRNKTLYLLYHLFTYVHKYVDRSDPMEGLKVNMFKRCYEPIVDPSIKDDIRSPAQPLHNNMFV